MNPNDQDSHQRQDHTENDIETIPAPETASDIADEGTPPASHTSTTAPEATAPEASASDGPLPEGERVTEHATGGAMFSGNATPDGTGYSTPNGGHGYAYAPVSNTVQRKHTRRYRVLLVAGVLTALLLVTLSLLGVWSILKDGYDTYKSGHTDEATSDYGTCGDLYIDDGTEELSRIEDQSDIEGSQSGSTVWTESSKVEESSDTQPPINATIDKSEPQRVDANGDGRADLAYDANGQVITSAGNTTDTAATVVAKVSASVVEIYTETLTSSWYGQYVSSGAGSGVIISPEGHIVTNHHVIDGAKTITVRLTDGEEYVATLIAGDEQTDVAVLWIDAGERALSVAKLGASFDLVVGEEIMAIGNPMGSLGGTVTYGKISATARDISVGNAHMTLLQVDAPINPGNSGGALFNMAGELVGVVNAKMSDEEIEGLGFAIPIDTAYDVVLDLIAYGYVTGRPSTGLTLVNVQNRYTGQYYVQISDSAYTDEMQAGDLLLKIDGQSVSSIADVSLVLSYYEVGDTVELTIHRNNQELTVPFVLREHTPDAST